METYKISLQKAKGKISSANYMLRTTYPTLRDTKFLIKIFEELHESFLNLVKAVLQYEYLYKRIQLYSDAQSNFDTFAECAEKYNMPLQEVADIKNAFILMQRHKESSMEFSRKDKFVIMSNELKTDSITLQNLYNYLATAKDILRRAESITSKTEF